MAVKSLQRAQERIEVRDLKLNALLEVTLAINSNVSKSKLYEIYQNALRQLNIDKLALFINEKKWDLSLNFGISKNEIKIDVQEHLLSINEITEVNNQTKGPFAPFDVVIPVYHKKKAVAYLLIGDIFNEAIKISPIIKHLPFIQTFTNIIAVAIENKTLAKEALIQEGVKKELELASEMQNMLLPSNFPENPHISISAFYQSHQEVGGDYYDVMWLDDNRVAFCIADVSGKGVSAAILMSNFQANVRVMAKHSKTLEQLAYSLNEKVLQTANGERFITLFIGVYDANQRQLTYINCGHNPPVLKQKNKIEWLDKGCPGLGMLDELPKPNLGKVKIHPDAVLVCYTDGLVEVENKTHLQFGPEGVAKVLQQHKGTNTDKLNTELILSLNQFKKTQPFVDDIAILSCCFY